MADKIKCQTEPYAVSGIKPETVDKKAYGITMRKTTATGHTTWYFKSNQHLEAFKRVYGVRK